MFLIFFLKFCPTTENHRIMSVFQYSFFKICFLDKESLLLSLFPDSKNNGPIESWQSHGPVPLPPPHIWRYYHAQPSPRWSEANLPTPLCRILGIAAHRDAVMCHLALWPRWWGTLSDPSAKTRLPSRATSGRVSEDHLCAFSPRRGQTRGRFADTFWAKLRLAPSSQQAQEAAWPWQRHSCTSKIVHLIRSQETTLCLHIPLLLTVSSETAQSLIDAEPERFWEE